MNCAWESDVSKNSGLILLAVIVVGLATASHAKDIFILPSDVVQSYQKLDANTKTLHCGGIKNHALGELGSFAS